jgi:uncharacterized SAM-binding protein YcdF (DUF218 family)
MRGFRKLMVVLLALCAITIVDAAFVYRDIPTHNTDLTHFDTLIVLGTPAKADGSPSPEQRERTLEGVREFKAGVASHLIMTGGAAHNQFVEAHVMKELAIAQGVPSEAVTEEGQAQNTVQNIFYSHRIMAAQHWTSAEVISSPSHLPRAALILEHYSFSWRTQQAPWPQEYSEVKRALHYCVEAEYCLRLKIFGFPSTPFLQRRDFNRR